MRWVKKILRRYFPDRRLGRVRVTKDWGLYCFHEHPGTELPANVLREILPMSRVRNVRHSNDMLGSGKAFIYVGHGDHGGAHSSEGFAYGLRQCFVEPIDVERWGASPLIWWCCFSASWLGKLKRADWLGFNDFIGYDARGGQGGWWREQLGRMFKVVFAVSEGRGNVDLIKKEMSDIYGVALKDHFVEDKIAYLNVVLAKLHSEGIAVGEYFGGRR